MVVMANHNNHHQTAQPTENGMACESRSAWLASSDHVHYLRSFPPGYRFIPKDLELIDNYLLKKIRNLPLPPNTMVYVNFYAYNPKELAEIYKDHGEKEWYFFTHLDRKYPKGKRPQRSAGDGYWKATGADKLIKRGGITVGFRKTLVFYTGKQGSGIKTNWIMHEFRLTDDEYRIVNMSQEAVDNNPMRLGTLVLNRIYEKRERSSPSAGNNQNDALDEAQDSLANEDDLQYPAAAVNEPAVGVEDHQIVVYQQEGRNLANAVENYVVVNNNSLPYNFGNNYYGVPDQYANLLNGNNSLVALQQPYSFYNDLMQQPWFNSMDQQQQLDSDQTHNTDSMQQPWFNSMDQQQQQQQLDSDQTHNTDSMQQPWFNNMDQQQQQQLDSDQMHNTDSMQQPWFNNMDQQQQQQQLDSDQTHNTDLMQQPWFNNMDQQQQQQLDSDHTHNTDSMQQPWFNNMDQQQQQQQLDSDHTHNIDSMQQPWFNNIDQQQQQQQLDSDHTHNTDSMQQPWFNNMEQQQQQKQWSSNQTHNTSTDDLAPLPPTLDETKFVMDGNFDVVQPNYDKLFFHPYNGYNGWTQGFLQL